MPEKDPHPVRVAMLLMDNMLTSAVALPVEMLRAADDAWSASNRGQQRLHCRFLACDNKAVATRMGPYIQPDAGLDDGHYDLVFVPGLWRSPRQALRRYAELCPWLVAAYLRGSVISAVGSGVFFLAEAGLLQGRPATVHWHYAESFSQAYPEVLLKNEYFITQAGKLFCSASINAMADVTVHLIEQFYTKAIARLVERNFSHEIRKPYEKRRFLEGQADIHADELVVEIQQWLQSHLHQSVSMESVAARFELSLRTFNRRFRQATGSSPAAWLQQQRLDAARELLSASNLSVGEVAFTCGYPDAAYFTRRFRQTFAITPAQYRHTVRAKLFQQSSGK